MWEIIKERIFLKASSGVQVLRTKTFSYASMEKLKGEHVFSRMYNGILHEVSLWNGESTLHLLMAHVYGIQNLVWTTWGNLYKNKFV